MPIIEPVNLETFLRRPEIKYDLIQKIDKNSPNLPKNITDRVEIEIKYEGYIKRQMQQIKKLTRLEKILIPENINYMNIINLRLEAREKLSKINPINLSQAQHVPGITPADIATLIIWIEKLKRQEV